MAADRFVLKQFAGNATNNGAFGAAQATGAGVQPVSDIKQVQSLNAFEQGWNAATLTADKLPALEEMQGLEALLCKSLKENYSEGIPFWIAGETYFQYSFVNYNGVLYYNTTGSYTNNNPATDTANWAQYKPATAGAADTAAVADKLGTSTVGSATQGIYLNNGVPTPMSTGFANQDLSNLTSTGEAHFANPALTNTGYTTNRILEIPQDIKLELNNGTLTLKAGSKVYVPNGAGVFDVVTIASDISCNAGSLTEQYMVFYNVTNGALTLSKPSVCVSGTSATSPVNGTMWYDTTNNVIKRHNGSSWLTIQFSFPICLVAAAGTSIDRVFNGFGYIGSTVFALPGVKAQVPNGKNADGTLKSVIYTTSSVLIHTQTTSNKVLTEFLYSASGLGGNEASNVSYNSNENRMYSGSNAFTGIALLDITTGANGRIEKFEPKIVDSIVNSNEFYQLKDNAVTLTDNQTITGTKTFTTYCYVKNNNLASNSTNASTNIGVVFQANNSTVTGAVSSYQTSSGQYYVGFYARKNINGTNVESSVYSYVNNDGAVYATAPTVANVNSSSTAIATTEWTHNSNKTGYGIGAPNYSAAVDATINSSTPYTATKNGWIQVSMPAGYGYIYIDGVVFALSVTVPNSYSTYQAGIAPIAKGSSVTTDNAANLSIKFIPCK